MLAYKKKTHSSPNRSNGDNLENIKGRASPFLQIADNRPGTAQLEKAQNVLQRANRNSRRRQNIKNKKKQEKIAAEGSDKRVVEFGDNWEVLEVHDYLKRHQLKQQRMTGVTGKSVMTLTDGSIILIDANQYWRHESATQENAYYDSSHTISGDNARTHFWTKKGHSLYQDQST